MSIEVTPLSDYLGAEIRGIDLSRPLPPDAAAAVQSAYQKHHLLMFRQPGLTEEDQIRLSRLFGDLLVRNSYDGSYGKEAHYISNNRPDGVLPIGEIEFHHDHLFYEKPLRTALLYAIEVPASGSRTRFRNMCAMLEKLPPALRTRAEAVQCEHFFNYDDNYSGRQDPAKDSPRAQRAWHPFVWRDEHTQHQALWMVRISTIGYRGVSHEEGEALLEELWQTAEQTPEINYIHEWQPGDMVIWNNLTLAHARLPFLSSEPRTLRRTSAI